MTRVITAPQPLPECFDAVTIFLAGSIDNGAAENWQARFIKACESNDVILLNPRREAWQTTITPEAHVPEFREQVEWELAAQERADIVAIYFAPESQAPISLLELGLFAHTGKVIVACPDGFWRKGNVEIVCERYGVPMIGSLEELISTVQARANNYARRSPRLYAGKFLALVKEGRWEYADRTNATGAAIIAAVTNEQKLLLVEQYRIPVHARTIELPAGIIGDEPGHGDEAHADAAGRELIEETGYEAEHIKALAHGPTSSGLTSETVTLFLATKLRRVGPGGGIAHENITVHEIPLSDVHQWLEAKAQEGVLVDPKIYAGLYFLGRGA